VLFRFVVLRAVARNHLVDRNQTIAVGKLHFAVESTQVDCSSTAIPAVQ
jgi:hypothetical protein